MSETASSTRSASPGASSQNASSPKGPPEGDASSQRASGRSDAGHEKPNLLERATALVGALLLLALVGFFVYELARGADNPPDLRVTLEPQAQRGGRVFLSVRVKNVGGGTAEDATVEVCAGPEACAELTFPFVPHGSARRGVVSLEAPLVQAPEGHVTSYRLP